LEPIAGDVADVTAFVAAPVAVGRKAFFQSENNARNIERATRVRKKEKRVRKRKKND
jgi:hypothetical protein